MEQITEESSSYDTLDNNVRPEKISLKKRTQSLRYPVTQNTKENEADESDHLSRTRTKKLPKRSASSPAIRIEVRVHRPLTWQVSSSSSSSIPRKSIKFTVNDSNESKFQNELKNETHTKEVLDEYDERKFVDEIRRKVRNRRWRQNQQNVNNSESSTDEDERAQQVLTENKGIIYHRRRKHSNHEKINHSRNPVKEKEREEEDLDELGENCSLVPILKVSLEPKPGFSSSGRRTCYKVQGEGGGTKKTNRVDKDKDKRSSRSAAEKSQSFGFDFPHRECHVSTVLQPVMTWFKEPGLHVNTKEREMGANGSTQTHHPHNGRHGRLKSRSHSSSALYTNKTGLNGAVSTPYIPQQGLNNGNSHSQSYIYNGSVVIPMGQGQGHPNGHGHGLSSSIPADLWDLPPNSKSYSPGRVRNQQQQSQQRQPQQYACVYHQIPATMYQKQGQPNQQQQHVKPTLAEAIMNRARKGRKGSSGGMTVEQHNISNRAKLYAVSCPDVANVNGNLNYGFHDEDESGGNGGGGRRLTQGHPDMVMMLDPAARPINSNDKSLATRPHQQPPPHYRETHLPHCKKYQRQRSAEETTSQQNRAAKCSYPFPAYPFITNDTVFEVLLKRDQLGLGLSVTGGSDSQESYPGLIRVKKVFPMGPAFQSARLRPWDIILKANGVPLTGLTNHEALEVLRTTPTETLLTISRPPANIPGFYTTDPPPHHSSHPSIPVAAAAAGHHHCGYGPGQVTSAGSTTQLPSVASGSAQLSEDPSSSSFKSKSLSSLKIPGGGSGPDTTESQSHLAKTYGEFEVTLEKYAGSLGFTLKQEDCSILGHYVRALVKDPALSDGRIQPGDRILSVNDVDLLEMSHAEAITFLRQCPGKVKLRLYRDIAPTPISPLSPTESHKSIKINSTPKAKPLRQEALDMLNDLAIRKQLSRSSGEKSSLPNSTVGRLSGLGRGGKSSGGSSSNNDPVVGPATLPRQRRTGHGAGVTPSPEVLSAALDRFAGRSTTPKSSKSQSPESGITGESGLGSSTSYPSETRSSGSGESTPAGTIRQCRTKKTDRMDNSSATSSDLSLNDIPTGQGRHNRRKNSFRQYTLHLDRISSLEDDSFSTDLNHTDSIVSEPGFGPGPNLQDKLDGSGSNNKFRHGQPAYQSAIVQPSRGLLSKKKNLSLSREDMERHSAMLLGGGNESPTTLSDIDIPSSSAFSDSPPPKQRSKLQSNQLNGTKCSSSSSSGVNHTSSSSTATTKGKADGLLKWKGVLFSQDDNEEEEDNLDSLDGSLALSPPPAPLGQQQIKESQGSSASASPVTSHKKLKAPSIPTTTKVGLPQRQSPDGREFRECDENLIEVGSSKQMFNGEQIFTVQLSRRWCSRLGFSLQGTNGHTFITAVYPDSVAGRDGRLRVGDEVIMVNNETVRDMVTTEVIDLMRKARGMISITLLRKPSPEPTTNASDHQLGLT